MTAHAVSMRRAVQNGTRQRLPLSLSWGAPIHEGKQESDQSNFNG